MAGEGRGRAPEEGDKTKGTEAAPPQLEKPRRLAGPTVLAGGKLRHLKSTNNRNI